MESIISVIIPVYNSAKYLRQCINSILAQTFQDFELLLLDDGSTDASLEICKDYEKKDIRIRVFSHPNMGVSKTREVGLRNASGQYIVFIDSDDQIKMDYLMVLYSSARDYAADVVCCNCYENDAEQLEIQKDLMITDTQQHMEAFWVGKRYAYAIWGKLYSREILANVSFSTLHYAEDLYVVTQVLQKCSRVVLLKYAGYIYVNNPESVSRAPRGIKRELDALVFMSYLYDICKEKYPNYLEACEWRFVILMFNLICAASNSTKENKIYAKHIVTKYIGYICLKKNYGIKGVALKCYLRAPALVSFLLKLNRMLKACLHRTFYSI